MGRLNNDALKAKVVQYASLREERDKIAGIFEGIDFSAIGSNPMAAMGQLGGVLGNLGDIKRGYELTREMEAIADECQKELVARIMEDHARLQKLEAEDG